MKSVFSLVFLTMLLSGCSSIPTLDDVLPDNRKEYKRSRALPDLEVPPDLTLDAEDNFEIPGEEEPTTLSAYQRHRKRGGQSELEVLAKQYPGEKVLPLPGTAEQIWPEILGYWQEEGYSIDLEDAELGVLETDWRETSSGESGYRDKFKIFAEPSEDGKNSILFISSERQEKITLGDGNVEWVDQGADEKSEKRIETDIKRIFYGDAPVVAEKNTNGSSDWEEPRAVGIAGKQAEIAKSTDDKIYLNVPDEFPVAWKHTEEVLDSGIFYVEDKDPEKGLFYIIYAAEEGKKKGWVSKLKFWSDDDDGTAYQLSLTGVGDKTEVVVLDDDGDWDSGEDASYILNVLMDEYNRL